MKADAHPTPPRKKDEVPPADELSGLGVMGSALIEIGWQLAAGILLPLWLVGRYKPQWFNSQWFALITIWIAFVFVSVVYMQLKKLPKKFGGLR